MRHRLTALLMILCLSVFLTACKDKPKQTVGVVDTARIFSESKAGIAGGAYLEALHTNMQDELMAMQEELQNNPSDETMMLFQKKYAEFQQRIGLEQEQVVTTLQTALQEALDTYRSKSGIEVLIESEMAMSMNKGADVTAKVIATLDKMDVVFTPVEMPEVALEPNIMPAVEPQEDVACQDEPCVDEACEDVACQDEPCVDEVCEDVACQDEPCVDEVCEDVACQDEPCVDEACEDVACQDEPCQDEPCQDEPCQDEPCVDEVCEDEACEDDAYEPEPCQDEPCEEAYEENTCRCCPCKE